MLFQGYTHLLVKCKQGSKLVLSRWMWSRTDKRFCDMKLNLNWLSYLLFHEGMLLIETLPSWMWVARAIVCSMEYGVDLVDLIELSFLLKCVWAPWKQIIMGVVRKERIHCSGHICRVIMFAIYSLYGPKVWLLFYHLVRSQKNEGWKCNDI